MGVTKFTHITLVLYLSLVGCSPSEGKDGERAHEKNRGAQIMIDRYNVGRFSLSVPRTMMLDAHTPTLRGIQLQEFVWPVNEKSQTRELEWKKHLSELTEMRKPEGVKSVIMEDVDLSTPGRWMRGVFYYGNYAQSDEGFWDVLVDAGDVGLWLKYDGLLDAKGLMLNLVLEAANHYESCRNHNLDGNSSGGYFCTRYGRIFLPYRYQESTYARFKGDPLDLQLEIEMNDTQVDEPKEEGLFARTAAAIATGYALGVDIKKVRSRNRMAAGIKGEEQVVRMKDKDGAKLDFTWRYAGKKNSGEFPEIVISMESPDGQIDEKLKVWDAVLDSMKPLYKTSP
jgi:hypothetical protein